jgi:hypothetical protein
MRTKKIYNKIKNKKTQIITNYPIESQLQHRQCRCEILVHLALGIILATKFEQRTNNKRILKNQTFDESKNILLPIVANIGAARANQLSTALSAFLQLFKTEFAFLTVKITKNATHVLVDDERCVARAELANVDLQLLRVVVDAKQFERQQRR